MSQLSRLGKSVTKRKTYDLGGFLSDREGAWTTIVIDTGSNIYIYITVHLISFHFYILFNQIKQILILFSIPYLVFFGMLDKSTVG